MEDNSDYYEGWMIKKGKLRFRVSPNFVKYFSERIGRNDGFVWKIVNLNIMEQRYRDRFELWIENLFQFRMSKLSRLVRSPLKIALAVQHPTRVEDIKTVFR